MDLDVGGRRIEAVTQLTKHGFVFVFDRIDRAAGLADRGATRAAEQRPGRADGRTAAVSDSAAPGEPAGRVARRCVRSDA